MYSHLRNAGWLVLLLAAGGMGLRAQDHNVSGNQTVSGNQSVGGNQTITGTANVGGAIDSNANNFSFGTQSTDYGSLWTYTDNPADTLTNTLNRVSAGWLWRHINSSAGTVPAMRLDSSHQLILYQADGTTAGLTFTPASSTLKLGTHANGTLTADANGVITAGGGFSVAGGLTNTTGSFTGGASGLTLNAGGTNQNITLNPGAGARAIVNGLMQVGNGTDYGWIFAGTSGGLNAFHVGSFTNVPLAFFANASAPRMVVATSGNVGIGTSTPAATLDVAGSIKASAGIVSASGSAIGLFGGYGAGLDGSMLQQFALYADTTNGLYFDAPKDASGNRLDIQFNWRGGGTPGLFIKGNTGNVGIGTATPSAKLDIGGPTGSQYGTVAIKQAAAGQKGLWLQANENNNAIALYHVGTHAVLSTDYTGSGSHVPLALQATGANVGIGTTNPQGKLDLGSGAAGISMVWGGTTGANHYASIGTAYSSGALSLVSGLKLDPSNDRYLYSYVDIGRAGMRVGGYPSEISFFSAPLSSQSVGSVFDYVANTKLIIKESGNIGIGTTAPTAKLEIYEPRSDVSLNTALELGAYANAGGEGPFLDFNIRWVGFSPNWIAGRIGAVYELNSPGSNRTALVFYTNDDNNAEQGTGGTSEKLRIRGDGNVGIGTTNPTHKLAVNGTIRATEIIVDTGWADYVFADDYRLAPLAEVEEHIRAKKHLPGVPSAAEVAANGVSMGEMQATLLAKVEELTLHLIAQQKEITALRAEVTALKSGAAP
jgi:hypothetical protein